MITAPRQIKIDFDSTCVLNMSPFVGPEIPGCVQVLKKLMNAGHDLILETMRVDDQLNEAVAWFKARGIKLYAKNCNPAYETGSRKIYGHLSIDDHNLGVPLIHNHQIHPKPFVDWIAVDKILEEKGYYIQQNVDKKSVPA
jgi:hypothetical protein